MKLGFSLIELIVVIALIGVLSAISVPIYKNYIIKIKIAESLQYIGTVADDLKSSYATGHNFPASTTMGGVSGINNAVWTIINYNNIYSVTYSSDGATYFKVGIRLKGLEGISGYVEPSVGLEKSTLFYGYKNVNGAMVVQCGQGDSVSYPTRFVPFEYLPSFCNCTNMTAGNCN